jgi:hypothetical protein
VISGHVQVSDFQDRILKTNSFINFIVNFLFSGFEQFVEVMSEGFCILFALMQSELLLHFYDCRTTSHGHEREGYIQSVS